MRKITNREEANTYFKMINQEIDSYIKNHKIRPIEISSYVRKNYNSFLEELGLSDIEGIGQIVNDVLDHRVNIERDGVIKFESFSILSESIINIEKPTIEHEKVLSDFYNTSLGHISVVDEDSHLYKVEDFGEIIHVFIFSDDEIQTIKKNVCESLVKEVESKLVSIDEMDNKPLGVSIKIMVGDICDVSKLRSYCEESLSHQKLIHIIKSQLAYVPNLPPKVDFDYIDEFDGYHIWEVLQGFS